ncbi:hypothetical protein BV22DRAFT_684468 [Leucogyrophana mollusca]|uniref:Uncharacterized protein n=1 Tax=Leucogyrophana mollusca TaxID=85980 RepID=A0ACB8B9W6_9AGAM|nr:hypothetical protein BV22DRAFT_684468 [Leucogyrophana mollusca]
MTSHCPTSPNFHFARPDSRITATRARLAHRKCLRLLRCSPKHKVSGHLCPSQRPSQRCGAGAWVAPVFEEAPHSHYAPHRLSERYINRGRWRGKCKSGDIFRFRFHSLLMIVGLGSWVWLSVWPGASASVLSAYLTRETGMNWTLMPGLALARKGW